jgi:hypothetical protein
MLDFSWYIVYIYNYVHIYTYMAVCQNLEPLVNPKIAGKWMFIPLKMVLIGIDPYPYIYIYNYINCFPSSAFRIWSESSHPWSFHPTHFSVNSSLQRTHGTHAPIAKLLPWRWEPMEGAGKEPLSAGLMGLELGWKINSFNWKSRNKGGWILMVVR